MDVGIGSRVLVKNKTKRITSPSKEYLIDYSTYYINQGVFLQQFVKPNEIDVLESQRASFNIWNLGQMVNERCEIRLNENLGALSFGILNALLLGDRGALDTETKAKFSEGGIMHILAVSGLHVGILYLILNYILGFLKRYRFGKPAYYLLILTILWSYALIAGWSNSVIRATLMFSIFLIAEMINRKHYPLNTTAFSALLILLFNPNALFQISFLLSYAAVFSIILFYVNFYRLLDIKNKFLKSCWKILCVSLAAQIGTFPITLYFFKTFQPAFLLFNLIAIPAAFVFLSLGLLLLNISSIKLFSAYVGKLVDVLIYTFDALISSLNSIFPALQNIQINLIQVILLYAGLYFICAFVFRKKLSYYVIFTAVIVSISGIAFHKKITRHHQDGVEFISKNHVVAYSSNRYFTFSINGSNPSDYHLKSIIDYYQLNNKIPISIRKSTMFDLITAENKFYLVAKNPSLSIPENTTFDAIIVNTPINNRQKEYFKSKCSSFFSYY